MRTRWEAGFTLVEVVIVTGIIAVIAGAAGTFFLAGTTPAVASANRDVVAALDEARRTAIAFDAATVVFTPAVSGSGYSARVYERFPGDNAFRARPGPAYDSSVAISETAAPLGAPGFAFTIDSHGNVTGLGAYSPSGTGYITHACPASGKFTLHLAYARDERIVPIPCRLDASDATPVAFTTPLPSMTQTPFPIGTCPSTSGCTLAVIPPPVTGAQCPPGFTADAVVAGQCDAATPVPMPTSTCPSGTQGTFPQCILIVPPTPTQVVPTPAPTIAPKCIPGSADANGFASCIAANPVKALGPSIARNGCGTHTPTADPGPAFAVEVDIFQNGAVWGTYTIGFSTAKNEWLDVAVIPAAPICGLIYTLAFTIDGITPTGGNASSNPYADTGDAAFAEQGVASILFAPAGQWGTNT